MNRREFNIFLAKLSVLGLIAPRVFAQPRDNPPFGIADLYQRAIVIDSLCGPFLDTDTPPDSELLKVIQQSGITAINFTISDRTFEGTLKNLAWLEALIEKYPNTFVFVRQPADIGNAKRDKKLGVLPGFQYTAFLEDDPERIPMFRDLGVRIMQLTYNNRSIFGMGAWNPEMPV